MLYNNQKIKIHFNKEYLKPFFKDISGRKQPKKDLDLTILLQLPYIFFIYIASFIVFASLVYFYQQINPNNLIF